MRPNALSWPSRGFTPSVDSAPPADLRAVAGDAPCHPGPERVACQGVLSFFGVNNFPDRTNAFLSTYTVKQRRSSCCPSQLILPAALLFLSLLFPLLYVEAENLIFCAALTSLCTSGVVRLHINSWLEVSFCLPHKIHYAASSLIPPEAIERSLKAIRPYHALLLLSDEKSLLAELPLDCSPALVRVIKTTSAVKNLQQLAQDADLALLQVFQLAAHLVYWGKAIIIYPLCENNVYMLSPNASVCLYSPLAEQFSRQFPAHDLPSVLAKFSLPVSLSEFRNPLAPPVQETQLIQMVVWMLQHRLLVQLHTYVCLMASPSEEEPHPREDDVPFTARVSGRSLSTPNALSFGSPTSSDDMTLTSPSMDNSSAELLPSGDSPLNKRMTENLLASLSEHERAAILSVPAAQNPEDLRMFARLLHYFRGRHHLEEIMYNENTRRSQLLMLFDKFRSVLVVTTHEDPVIAVFQALLP
ncbi:GATOR complex protein NPRL3 isoform X4 [Vulpes lagopus]|uniref:GATOR complex protein NPRL3 isoform X4 n=1 Tax=Vulpes lagopus TaxID=494514 RepID=UPI001BC994D1|nr:GATOR complex protein NPRL3 isoform X4 [Vulpes lagopus]